MRWVVLAMMLVTVACCTTRSDMSAGPGSGNPMDHPDPVGATPPEQPVWVAVDGDTTYTLSMGADGRLETMRAGDTQSERLVWNDESTQAHGNEMGITAGAAVSCVEVVGVEADAMLVRVGTLANGTCVLSDKVLRFARQTQR